MSSLYLPFLAYQLDITYRLEIMDLTLFFPKQDDITYVVFALKQTLIYIYISVSI